MSMATADKHKVANLGIGWRHAMILDSARGSLSLTHLERRADGPLAVCRNWSHLGCMTPRLVTDPAVWPAVLALLHEAFGYMEGRINPPSSLRDLTPGDLTRQTQIGEIWVIGTPVGCMFLTPKPGALYLGKLAVATSHRGQGLARQLVDQAEDRARALRLPALELQTRVELAENHRIFQSMGFCEAGRTAHPGFASPTSITYRRPVAF
jgi:ribosomal protein S18 acetylase RimI-like enzyme